MTELIAALIGAVVGAAITYFAAVRLADRDRRLRGEDQARDLARRQGEMRVALASALDRNVAILDEIPGALGTGKDAVVPQTVDLALLDATAEAKFAYLDEVSTCAAIDRARSRLAAVRHAMEHRATVWSLTSLGIQVGSSASEMEAKREWSSRLLDGLARDVREKLIPSARVACDEALVALRGYGAKAVDPAKPTRQAKPGEATEAPKQGMR